MQFYTLRSGARRCFRRELVVLNYLKTTTGLGKTSKRIVHISMRSIEYVYPVSHKKDSKPGPPRFEGKVSVRVPLRKLEETSEVIDFGQYTTNSFILLLSSK